MLQFQKDGKIVMTEKDNGEIKITEDAPKDWVVPKKPAPGGPIKDEQSGEGNESGSSN